MSSSLKFLQQECEALTSSSSSSSPTRTLENADALIESISQKFLSPPQKQNKTKEKKKKSDEASTSSPSNLLLQSQLEDLLNDTSSFSSSM